ncbi:MAG: hypothetical protein AAB634_01255 [Patescibacteria group bacterium]
MVRGFIIVAVAFFLVIGVGIFFGLRAAKERLAEPKEENRESTSTEVKAKGRGFFGFLHRDFVSKEQFERGDSGFQLNRWGDEGGSSGSSDASSLEESGGGFILRRDMSPPSPKLSSGGGEVPEAPAREPKPPFGFTKEALSPFFGKVEISSLQPPTSDYARTAAILTAQSGALAVNVTGWKLRTNIDEVVIPQAIGKYVPGATLSEDIMLRSGDTLSLFGHYRFAEYQHPFGKNVRLNECTGYLNALYPFEPKLPTRCPRLNQDEVRSLSGACQTYISNLGSCKTPASVDIANFQGDRACQSFLRRSFGYAPCYEAHKNEENFFSREWYAWLSPQMQIPIARDHDRVFLFDRNGLLVDEFSY